MTDMSKGSFACPISVNRVFKKQGKGSFRQVTIRYGNAVGYC